MNTRSTMVEHELTGRRHVGSKAKAGNVDEPIFRAEVVENVPLNERLALILRDPRTSPHLCFIGEDDISTNGNQ